MRSELLLALVVAVLLAAIARRNNVSAPLALVVAGLVIGLLPGVPDITLDPELVLYVLLPPLLWSAGLESSYVNMRRNVRAIGMLAVGLPLATTVAVGFVAYQTVPQLTLAAALTLGAIVAPPDAVSASAIGRRLGLPRRIMTLIGGESLLNDATSLTAYKVALGAAIGAAASWQHGLATFVLAVAGGVAVGAVLGTLIVYVRWRLDDSTVESAIGLLAPFVIYWIAEQVHQRIAGALDLKQLGILDRAMRADNAVAWTDHDQGVGIGRTQPRLELAREAVVQTFEFGFFGFRQIEIRKHPPARDRSIPHQWILDLAEPSHEPRQRRPGNAVGQQEVQVLLLRQGGDQAPDCHDSVRWTG